MYSSVFHQRAKAVSDLVRTRLFTRLMGGGPRTFPGGINKWQWKHLHEKRAKEKEKRLLQQEKQLYQARIRSQIRAKLSGKPQPDPNSAAMSPTDHIKAIADRFMKEGAEDLWNEDDGPVKAPEPNQRPASIGMRSHQRRGSINSPVDIRKLISEGSYTLSYDSGNPGNGFNFNHTRVRDYSTRTFVRNSRKFRRNESSSEDDDDSDYGFQKDLKKNFDAGSCRNSRNMGLLLQGKQGRFSNVDGKSEDEGDEGVRGGRSVKREIGSRAALGKYDVRFTKRVPLNEVDLEIDFATQVELIRHELSKKKNLVENEGNMSKNGEEESFLSKKRFDECGISPLTVKALTATGYIQMTRVQEATLSVCLEGNDALVKAKTGTGKSAAFLLPAIEAVLKATCDSAKTRVHPINVLIVCPTRELASQIAAEARALLKYHNGIGVQTLVGGTRFKDDQKSLESDPCQILVATPGRLLDHIESRGGLSVHLMGLKMLILDEADHLLDLGFRKDVEKIVDCLPRQRQSLLFSATVPKEVRRISQLVLKRDHAFVDTVGLGCVETHDKVKQSFLVVSQELHFQVVHLLLQEHILRAPDYKVIVFCTTGMATSLMYQLLREMKMNVREMHSRKPQLYRTRVSDEFKESKRMILVTSDVSARGMNYPDVTLVIQVGMPLEREQYIHRLGRTGREGKDGEGILLLAPWEEYFLDELKDLALENCPIPDIDPETKLKVEDSMSKVDVSVREGAYHAWLGYYNSIREIGRDKTTLAELANQFSYSIGLEEPPPLLRRTALKMGLKGIPGIKIRQS